MSVRSLGYVIIEATDLERWRQFALTTLGLMAGPLGPDGSLRLRIDERPFRLAVIPGRTDRFVSCGWEFRRWSHRLQKRGQMRRPKRLSPQIW